MTASRRRQAALLLLLAVFAAPRRAPAQTPVTLQDAMNRARGQTADARALASITQEAEARVQQAQSGFWPRVDVSETVQRGNDPVFVFSSLLSQRRFSEANFAIPALNHPDPLTNTRTGIAVEQRIFDAGSTLLAVEAAKLDRDMAVVAQDGATRDLAFRAAQAFVRVLQLEAVVRATDAAVAASESDQQRARARRETGLATEADVLAVEVHMADIRQRQITAAGNLTVARIQLAEAMGLPLTTAVIAVRPSPRPTPADGDTLVREALNLHPQRRQAELRQQLADKCSAQRTGRAAADCCGPGGVGIQRSDARHAAIELGGWC